MTISTPRLDIFRMLTDLGEREWTLDSLSLQLGVPRSTIIGWKQGARPKYEEAARLIDLWCGSTGKLIGEVPRLYLMEDSAPK